MNDNSGEYWSPWEDSPERRRQEQRLAERRQLLPENLEISRLLKELIPSDKMITYEYYDRLSNRYQSGDKNKNLMQQVVQAAGTELYPALLTVLTTAQNPAELANAFAALSALGTFIGSPQFTTGAKIKEYQETFVRRLKAMQQVGRTVSSGALEFAKTAISVGEAPYLGVDGIYGVLLDKTNPETEKRAKFLAEGFLYLLLDNHTPDDILLGLLKGNRLLHGQISTMYMSNQNSIYWVNVNSDWLPDTVRPNFNGTQTEQQTPVNDYAHATPLGATESGRDQLLAEIKSLETRLAQANGTIRAANQTISGLRQTNAQLAAENQTLRSRGSGELPTRFRDLDRLIAQAQHGTEDERRKIWRSIMLQIHPDRATSPEAKAILEDISKLINPINE